MEKVDERDPEIGAKSARAGFVAASVLLVLLSIYEIIGTGEFPPALGVLGASQAVFWIFYLYYRKSRENCEGFKRADQEQYLVQDVAELF